MCGIVGLFAKSADVEERLGHHLGAMLVQMADRGPDSAGLAVYRDPAPAGATNRALFSAYAAGDWEADAAGLRGLGAERGASHTSVVLGGRRPGPGKAGGGRRPPRRR